MGSDYGCTPKTFDTIDEENNSDACTTELLKTLHRGSQLETEMDHGGWDGRDSKCYQVNDTVTRWLIQAIGDLTMLEQDRFTFPSGSIMCGTN